MSGAVTIIREAKTFGGLSSGEKKSGTGDPLHTQEPVTVASFRTWRGWRECVARDRCLTGFDSNIGFSRRSSVFSRQPSCRTDTLTFDSDFGDCEALAEDRRLTTDD